jgi:hypothetical protein
MTYEERRAALIRYLNVKVEEEDWHGVSDAACDLRVMEASRLTVPLTSGKVLPRMRTREGSSPR